MRAAKIVNGLVANVILVEAVPAGFVACPDHIGIGMAIDAAPPVDLDALRATRRAKIEHDRDAACYADVMVFGRPWQADQRSQALLGQAITLASAGLPLPTAWRDVNNDDMPITTIADLLAIAGAIAAQVQAAYALSWQEKAALEAVPD